MERARVYLRRKPWRSQTFVLRRANIYVIYMRRGVLAMAGTKRATKVILSALLVCVGLRADEQSARAV
jgi:hypothetical protein